MWDWSLCDDPAARFENLVASQLLKCCHHHEDTAGEAMSLRMLRKLRMAELLGLRAACCRFGQDSLLSRLGCWGSAKGT